MMQRSMVGPNDFNDREQGAKFDGDDTSSESHSSAYRNVAINDAKRGGRNQSNLPKSGSFDGDRDDMNDDKDTKAVVAYRDYSKDQPSPLDNSSSFGREGSTQTFPMKLHAILLNPEFVDIIAWLPHGRAWRILQMKAFEEQVIPLYFRHGRYSSFARQVNGWGFRRITHGPDYNSYYHEKFLKGLPYLCDKMKRLTSEDIKRMQKDNFVLPDFYALSRDCPLPDSKAGDSMLQMPFRTSMPESQAPASAFSINPSLLSHAAAGLSLPTPATLKPTIPSGIAASPADINFLLSMNLGSARGSQQQNMETESAWLNALSSWNKLSLQIKGTNGVIADPSSNSDLHSLEARRNEIIQRLMCSGGQGNAPAPSASSPFPSSARAGQIGNGDAYLISQLRDLLNPKTSKDGVDGVLNLKPDQIASLLQNFWHTLAPSVNSYSAQAPSSNLADLSNTLIGRDIFHLLGQQGLNPTVLANIRTLLPMTSNQSQTMRESSFALRAPSDSVDQDVDHSLTQKQLCHEPTNNTAPPSSFNNPSVGENDLVSLVRQLQKSSTSSATSSQETPPILNNSNTILQQLSSNAIGSSIQNMDISSLLRLQQQLQHQGSAGPSSIVGNPTAPVASKASSLIDPGNLSQLLNDPVTALLLRLQQVKSHSSATDNQTQSMSANNQGISMTSALLQQLLHPIQTGIAASQRDNASNSSHNKNHYLQLLEQVLRIQQSNNNNTDVQNVEAALRAFMKTTNGNNNSL